MAMSPAMIASAPTMRPPVSGSLRMRRLPSVEQSSMVLGVMTPMWPPGANSSPPAVNSTYGAPAPQARNSAAQGLRLARRRRANSGSSNKPATPKRSAVISHASSALFAIDSFVIAGKPPQISAASAPNVAPAIGRKSLPPFAALPPSMAVGDGPGSLIDEPLVDAPLEALQRLDRGRVVERQILHQEHAADAARGIDPELGVEDPGPAHAAGRAREPIGVRPRDLKAQSELVAAGAEREGRAERRQRRGLLLDENGADVVLAHQHDRRLAQEPHAVRGAAVVEEQLDELRIVGRRRVQAAVAVDGRRDLGRGRRLDEAVGRRAMHGHDTTDLWRRHRIKGVAHAERNEDALGHELVERLARYFLDERSEHARALAVGPARARIVQQREPG